MRLRYFCFLFAATSFFARAWSADLDETNLALKQPATACNGNAAAVVDGNTGGEFFKDAVLEATGAKPWWQVDLGRERGIGELRIWNRSDCCSNRLREFWIFASSTPFDSDDPDVLKGRPGVWSRFVDAAGGYPSSLNLGVNGRFVRVQLATCDVLDLAEVEVIGSPQPFRTDLSASLEPRDLEMLASNTAVMLHAKAASGAKRIVFRSDGMVIGTSDAGLNGECTQPWRAREGTHRLTATAIDVGGRAGVASEPVCITVAAAATRAKIPVILDTDIGGDADDTFALAMLLGSPEFDVKLVTSSGGDGVEGRAIRIASMLTAAGRTDIPIGVGVNSHYTQIDPAVVASTVKYAGTVYPDGVGTMIKAINDSPVPITLICISPLQNIGQALQRDAGIARNARVVAMWGGFRRDALDKPTDLPEHNVTDLPGSRAMLAAPWEITIAPLNTAGLIQWHGNVAARIRDSRTGRAGETWKFWQGWGGGKLELLSLYDTEAVYLALPDAEDRARKLNVVRMNVRLTEDGRTVLDETAGRPIDVALSWRDPGGFNDLAVGRIALDLPR